MTTTCIINSTLLPQNTQNYESFSVTDLADYATLQNQVRPSATHLVYYAALLICIAGCTGNLLGIIVWLNKEFRKMSRFVICITLAVANTVSLAFGEITTSYFQVGEFLSQSDIICQTKIVLVGISLHLDSWLIVYLSIERFLALFRPHLSKIIFGQVKTVLYVLTVTLLSTAFNFVFAISHVSVVKFKDGTGMCNFDPSILNQIRYLLRGQIPLLLIIPCNIVIIGKVMAQYKKMRNAVAVTQQQIQKNKSIKASVLTLSITLSYISFSCPLMFLVSAA